MDYSDEWPDELQHLWENLEHEFVEHISDEREAWIEQAAHLFEVGWIEDEVDPETRQGARDEFFSLMEEFDISIDVFDWDDWRDWYSSA